MEEVEQFDISIEELADGMSTFTQVGKHLPYDPLIANLTELPENSPRYVVLSYELNHKDGRISFPLVLINWSPVTGEIGMLTLHASALINLQATLHIFL